MLASDMNLKIKRGAVGYNHKILVSDGNFSLGKNDEVKFMEAPAIKSHRVTQTAARPKHNSNDMWYHMHQLSLRKIRNLRLITTKKNCFGTFYDGWFCHMEYFSMKHENGNCSSQFRAELIITQNSDAF